MRLIEALDLKPREIISLVGAGGKTTLMFALAREVVTGGQTVITTTTTKILEPSACETPILILDMDEDRLIEKASQNISEFKHITLAREKLAAGKLRGVTPGLIIRLGDINIADYIVIEADGAAHHSLKAPDTTEPVVPANTSLVIPLAGIDAVSCQLTDECVFRSEIASRLLESPLGSIVSTQSIAILLTHPLSIIKYSPWRARIIPFINKMDLDADFKQGRDLAQKILDIGHPQIDRVVLGQVRLADPVIAVIKKK